MGQSGVALRIYMRGKEVWQTKLISLTSDLSSAVPQQTLASIESDSNDTIYNKTSRKNTTLNKKVI